MASVEEPLLESAPLAWRLAPQLCQRQTATGEDCSSEHGVWQYLRVMGLVGSIETRAEFYHQALAAATSAIETPRILLSGTADYAMLALVLEGFRKQGKIPAITVVDLCETPLALNRWYAERAAIEIETVRDDILRFAPSAPFDAVCTDAFFGRFPPDERPALVMKWRELLRPGGSLVTTNRLRPTAPERVGFSPDEAQAFRAAAQRIADEMRDLLQVDPVDLAQRAETYAMRHFTYAVRSQEEIRELFERRGFSLTQLTPVVPARTGAPHGTSGPSVRGNRAASLQIVAERT